MCGIGGFVGERFSERKLTDTMQQVCRRLRHRGPDEQGYFIDAGVALGTARLSIRDPAHGQQPMTERGVTIVFNGEIYNAEALRSKIPLNEWKTESDTEVILEGYLHYGVEIFEELAGMFAFALWDDSKKSLFLVRDRWGEKPLYYAASREGVAFASEIGGLRPWDHLEWEVHLPDMLSFLTSSYIPTPHSGWKNILKLRPGFYLKWTDGDVELRRYHRPKVDALSQKPSDLKSMIETSVKQCAVSDKPVGAFLSGGVDSSIIVRCLQRYLPSFPVYSIDWEDTNYSEKKYSTMLCQKLGLKQHLITCTPHFMVTHFDTIVSLYGEPFGDESMIPTFCLAKRAKEDVDVVLTGDGADEFFHGYERYFFDGEPVRYSDIFSSMNQETRGFVLAKDVQSIAPTPPFSFQDDWDVKHIEPLRSRSLEDIHGYLVDDILMKVDRATMGVGLEARAPFLMPAVTDFALNLSINHLIEKGKQGKWILREAMKDQLPSPILNRKKQGFGVPLGSWFNGDLKEWMKERLLAGILPELGWFSMSGIQQLCQEPARYSRAIFNLLVLASYLESRASK